MRLGGSLPVVPTPFYKGRIDFESLLRLIHHLFPELEGFTLCGSTGESVSLSLAERIELMEFAMHHAPPGKAVVVGLTHTNLEEMIALARRAAKAGVRAGLVPCPYYFTNSFTMVLEFFKALDSASDLELVLYDNPVYTKTLLRTEDLFAILDACPHITGVKITDHDLGKITALKQNRDVAVFSGDDVVAFRSLLLGVDGSMIIAPAIFPASYQEVVGLVRIGNHEEALRMFSDEILPFIHLFGLGDEISNTKALFKEIGIFRSDEVRLPLLPASRERLKEIMLAYRVGEKSKWGARRKSVLSDVLSNDRGGG
ncbi:MAG: dihydrodipicolinate synthase family protein [Terriglobia bacterium]